MKFLHALLGALCIIFTVAGGCVSTPQNQVTPPTGPLTAVPTLPPGIDQNISQNWAGYAVQTSFASPENNSVETVEATWNVPVVDCVTPQRDYASAFWIGIDGISSKTVEQIGTDSDCIQGAPRYYAWYEFYPRGSVNLNITINPGDEVHAKVEYAGNNSFRFTLQDLTSKDEVSFVKTSPVHAGRTSAEWIAEAPVYGHQILPLADFGPVDFMNASVTIKGINGPISSNKWEYQAIIMENRGGLLKAVPTTLMAGGKGFSIKWEHA